MAYRLESLDGATIVHVDGELNALSSADLKLKLGELAAEPGSLIVVDLQQVPFIDSSGLGALVFGVKNAKLHGSRLVLLGLQPQARVVFDMTSAYSIFQVFDSLDAALAAQEV